MNTDRVRKAREFFVSHRREIFAGTVLFLVVFLAFLLGYLIGQQGNVPPIIIEKNSISE